MTKEILHINLPDAKNVLKRGLDWAVGGKAIWKPEYEDVADWLTDNKGKGLLCFGGSGLGKTLICDKVLEVIFKYYLHKNYVKYTPFSMGASIEDIKGQCPTFIDDIGLEPTLVEYGTRKEPFVEIVYNAEKEGQLLILTTNLDESRLRERYGERTIDRLKAITRPVVFSGESMRK